LRFWPPKTKTTKPPPKFCICGSFGPQGQFWLGLRWRGTLSEVPCVIFLQKIGLPGPKLLQLQNIKGGFVVFFLRGSKSQFRKSQGTKTAIRPYFYLYSISNIFQLFSSLKFKRTQESEKKEREIIIGSFYGAIRKLTLLKKLILILMFDSFLNGWLLINDQ